MEDESAHEVPSLQRRDALRSSSVKVRLEALTKVRQDIKDSEQQEEILATLQTLLSTYPRYEDRKSRKAVRLCLSSFLRTPGYNPDAFKIIVKYVSEESGRGVTAPTNAFVLLEWCSLLLQELSTNETYPISEIAGVCQSAATALEKCLYLDVRSTLQHAARIVARQGLTAVLLSKKGEKDCLGAIIKTLTSGPNAPTTNAPYIGVIASTCSKYMTTKADMEAHASEVIAFYTNVIIGSKSIVPVHIVIGLQPFFRHFVSYKNFVLDVVPTLEKAVLRSPEVVLQGQIPPLAQALETIIDLSEVLAGRLLQPLLSALRSTSTEIREGASQALAALLERSRETVPLLKAAEDLLAALKSAKGTNTEFRALVAGVIGSIHPSETVSSAVVKGMVPVAMKEANETALRAEVSAACRHLLEYLRKTPGGDKSVFDPILKACSDKRIVLRKAWLLGLGRALQQMEKLPQLEGSAAKAFVEAVLRLLLDVFEEVSANPLPAAQSGLAPAAFPVITMTRSKAIEAIPALSKHIPNIISQALAVKPKISFLLNPRVYSKLSDPDESGWALSALISTVPYLNLDEEALVTAWAQAVIYILSSPDINAQIRKAAGIELSKAYLHDPKVVGQSMVLGIWQWLRTLAVSDKDSAAFLSKANPEQLRASLRCITPPRRVWDAVSHAFPHNVIEKQCVRTALLFRTELIPGTDWIESCLRLGVDPGRVAEQNRASFLSEIMSQFQVRADNRWIAAEVAARNAIATLAFVAPDYVIPLVIDAIAQDLSTDQFTDIGPTEIGIAYTPEGTAFVDVLTQKTNHVSENKNIKDYDTLKWEEELRLQLSQKKGPLKKLTAEQQARVGTQLAHEANVRQKIWEITRNIRRGAAFVQGLAEGPPTEARLWMASAVTYLLDAMKAGAALLEPEGLVDAYIACASQVTSRLGTLRQFIGVATLRTLESIQLSPGFDAEPLGELVTRVLYRLRFTAEQRPFDVASLSYMFPLIFRVLDAGSVGHSSGEDAEAQVLLALEFMSFHMSMCSDTYLPRFAILSQLIASMRRYTPHYRLLKDALLEFCRSISSSIQPQERDMLLESLASPEVAIRSAVLQAIHSELDISDLDFSEYLWLACHDAEEDNADTAMAIWEENEFSIEPAKVEMLLKFLASPDRSTRVSAGRALAAAVVAQPAAFEPILSSLQATYRKEAQPLAPKRDKYGMVQKTDLSDHWERRSGLAIAFMSLTSAFPDLVIVPFMNFMITNGPLYDRNTTVRSEMLHAGTTLVASRGAECLEPLMQLLEATLDSPAQDTQEADWLNEAVIILYGSLARNLPSGDERIQTVVAKLIQTLKTPSESVQFAVANCLAPLMRMVDTESGSYVTQLLEELLTAKQYAARRGAAYGLAGVVSGRGISALRQYRIMSSLRGAAENKKSVEHRQGALFAYEMLSTLLGRTFEPYIIEVLPQLLACFGDPAAPVRDACLYTAKSCFASLSSFGVHQVLPRLLEGLDETQWRSKKGACELLGAMAYLDSQQLANSLPDIIPPLTAVLNDSHKEVRAAANNSLQRFGEVISNPEVKSLVNVLLKALSDPTKYTDDALDGLIKVSFVHYLDAPSLALVVRILERGLGDRSSTKRKSAQIIGSLAHLTERKDLSTHLPILVSGLREASIDPVPATRATASKALGSLVEKLGEDAFPDLIPSLMSSLRSDTGAGDRLGSAQALSEVLAGLGTTRLEDTLPTILQNVSSTRPSVREGFMTLFIFLPACFGNSFANYLSQIIPSILGGLADEIEAIRDISLRAGRLLVKNFATKAIDLLLPELQRGLADDSYRIRLSSVELVGDLLFSLTGISQTSEADEEDESAAQAGQSLLEVLGEERRNKVLSSLYICRCDTSGMVRSAAIAVWKALVATPRTLRELVPTLTQMIINRLASSNMEQKVIAGNALGEVIKKAGEGVFAALLPSLELGLETSTDADYRQGICMALREVVHAAQPETLEDHEKKLISIVRLALVDSEADVREAAAESFDALQQIFGKRAVDQVLPHLLTLLRDESEAENALSALLTLLTEATRANVILPNLIPTLLTNPISAFNARALASLARVGGSSMNRRLPIILNTLCDNIVACKDTELQDELDTAFDAVLDSVDEYDGLNTAMSVMLAMIKHEDHRKRAAAASHLATFFSTTTVDYSRYNQDLIRVLLISFDDRSKEVVSAAWQALSQLQSHLRKEEMESLVGSTRQILGQVGVAGSNLPGFALPKGILPVLQIFLQGLMNGTSDQRVQAASGIADIIERSGPDSLKPFVTQITGPLIRVVGERSVEVKSAILYTLSLLLGKIPTFLRPFLPQLQRTFTKSIADPTSSILRERATKALSTLITLTPRVDPLIAELVTGAKTQDPGVKNAMLKALQDVVSKVGSNMTDTSRESILSLIDSQHDAQDDNMMVTNSRLLGAMIKVLPAASAAMLIKSRVVSLPSTNASLLTLNAVLVESPESLTYNYPAETRHSICQGINGKSIFIQQNAVLAAGKLLLATGVVDDGAIVEPVLDALSNVIAPGSDIDTRRLALVVVRTISRHHSEAIRPYLAKLAPPVFASVRDPVIPVKLAAEAAFLELFSVVDAESSVFDEYMGSADGKALPAGVQRTMGDYFKRVALRLGGQARERKEAEGGGGGLGLATDEVEDEREVWSVGKVEVGGNGVFGGD